MRTVVAKFPGICNACREPIMKGDLVVNVSTNQGFAREHALCHQVSRHE